MCGRLPKAKIDATLFAVKHEVTLREAVRAAALALRVCLRCDGACTQQHDGSLIDCGDAGHVRIEQGRAPIVTNLMVVEATSPVETDPFHPASFANSPYGPSAAEHIRRTRTAVVLVGEIIGTSGQSMVGTSGVIAESIPTGTTESSMKGHAQRVSGARDAVAAAAALRGALPQRPIINELEDLWSESMVDSVERVVTARLAREAEATASALRLAKALKRNRKMALSTRAQQSEARFLARMARSRS